jgi:hypothetical protein
MPILGKLALVVTTGGIALGAMLGAAADPKMKQPPEEPWRGALQAPYDADAGHQLAGTGSEPPLPYRDSYAPSWADEELTDWEPDYPAWTYGDLFDQTVAEPEAVEDSSSLQPETPVPAEAPSAPVEPEALPPEPRVAGSLAALY